MKKTLLLSTLLGGLFALGGCASIVGSREESVSFNTNVKGAEMVITNKSGKQVYSGEVPTTLSLKKKAGFFSGEKYTITATKSGYIPQEQTLDTGVSGWYWGNLLFGGLLGILIIDPATGAMWTFDEENVFLNLPKQEN